MCLYPRLIKNRKYSSTKKNGGNIPEIKDPRTMWVPVGCNRCMECKKQKARAWSIRLQEEIRTDRTGQFVTLTFSNESIQEITKDIKGIEGYDLDNEIATIAVRRFLERWRKKYKTSVKHWLTTELGGNGTENIHLHGIIFSKNKQDIKEIWKYGFVYVGDYVNEETINYCVKYTTKTDVKHKEYQAKILTSKGIGSNYINRDDAKRNIYNEKGETRETYTTREGLKIALPIYWRNKIYTEEERESLWLQKLDKQERWVNGTKIDVSKNMNEYQKALAEAQQKNTRLGYGTSQKNWQLHKYETEQRNANLKKRLKKFGYDEESQ